MPAGRPSKYKEAYCDLVIEEMAQGKSLTAFAAEIGVSRDTITEWVSVHDAFSLAVKIGKAKCAAWWEAQGRACATTGGDKGRVTAVIFGLKNMGRDDWADRVQNEHTGKDGGPIETKDTSDMGQRIALALRAAANKGA